MEAKQHEFRGRSWIRGIGNPPHAYIPINYPEVETIFYQDNYRPAALIYTVVIQNHQHRKKASTEVFIYYPGEGKLWRIDTYGTTKKGSRFELKTVTEVYPHLYENILRPIDNELVSMIGGERGQDG